MRPLSPPLVLLFAVALALALLLALFPVFPRQLTVEEGDVAARTIRSPRDKTFVSAVLTEQEREKAAEAVPEVLVFEANVRSDQLSALATASAGIARVRANDALDAAAKRARLLRITELSELSRSSIDTALALPDPRWQGATQEAEQVLRGVMTASIPPKDPAAAKRIEQRKQITAEHNAPLAVFLASDAAAGVTGQVFSTRKNEIFLMSQPRPLRGIHRSEGWTPQACAEHMLPAFKTWFFPLDRTADVFSWDSI